MDEAPNGKAHSLGRPFLCFEVAVGGNYQTDDQHIRQLDIDDVLVVLGQPDGRLEAAKTGEGLGKGDHEPVDNIAVRGETATRHATGEFDAEASHTSTVLCPRLNKAA